jgi:hypothetical protein
MTDGSSVINPKLAQAAHGRPDAGCVVNPYPLTESEHAELEAFAANPKAMGKMVLGVLELSEGEEMDARVGYFAQRLNTALGILGADTRNWPDAVQFAWLGKGEGPFVEMRAAHDDAPHEHGKTLGFYLAGIASVELAGQTQDSPRTAELALRRNTGGLVLVSMQRMDEMVGDSVIVSVEIADTSAPLSE